MHDLFGITDHPLAEALRVIVQHGMVAAPVAVMTECLNVLHILAADADDADEAEQFRAVISQVERVVQQNMEMK